MRPNSMSRDVKWHKFTKNELWVGKTLPHDVAILNCTIIIFIFGKFMSFNVSLHRAWSHSACIQRSSQRTELLTMSWFVLLFSESQGDQSLCFIHVKKPHHPYFQHTKYEPDISSHARKKWGVKITVDFGSPCSATKIHQDTAKFQSVFSFAFHWIRMLHKRWLESTKFSYFRRSPLPHSDSAHVVCRAAGR